MTDLVHDTSPNLLFELMDERKVPSEPWHRQPQVLQQHALPLLTTAHSLVIVPARGTTKARTGLRAHNTKSRGHKMSIRVAEVPIGELGTKATVIAWSNPEKLNAVSPKMLSQAADVLEAIEADDCTVAVVFCGDPASKLTSSGADLSADESELAGTDSTNKQSPVERFMRLVVRSSRLVCFAVYAGAVGMNLTLLPHCDLVVATDDAWFATPFGTLGICPEWGASRTLPRCLGRQRAQRIMLWGDKLPVAEAFSCGLVTRVVATDTPSLPSAHVSVLESLRPLLTPALSAALSDVARLVASVPRPVESVRIFRAMLRAGEAHPDNPEAGSISASDGGATALELAGRAARMSMEELVAWELRVLEARVAEGVPVEAMMARAARRHSRL